MLKAAKIMNPHVLRYVFAVGVVFALMSPPAAALAGTSGGIAGTVTDAKTGAQLSGVTVQISSPGQATTVMTDARGHFIALSLQPDDYTLTAEKEGYVTKSVSGYTVSADQTQRYDIELTPNVSGSPPG